MYKAILVFLLSTASLIAQINLGDCKTEKSERTNKPGTGAVNIKPETTINGFERLNSAPRVINTSRKTLVSPGTRTLITPLAAAKANETAKPNEFLAFEINPREENIEIVRPNYNLNSLCYDALSIAPNWIKNQLKLKFRELSDNGLDDDYAQIILDAAEVSTKIGYSPPPK